MHNHGFSLWMWGIGWGIENGNKKGAAKILTTP